MADPRTKVLLQTGQRLFNSIYYELLSEGYSENYVDGQPSITMRVRTRWPGSYKFIANMTGTAAVDITAATGMTRFTPAEFPDTDYQATIWTQGDANNAFLGWWCTGARLVGTHGELTCQDQTTGALVPPIRPDRLLTSAVDYQPTSGELYDNGYDSDNKPVMTGVGMAEYELTYEPLPYEIITDAEQATLDSPLDTNELCRYVIRRYRFGGNNFTLQPGSLYWRDRLQANANDPEAQILSEAVRPFPNANLSYTWVNVPGIPWDAIVNCIGKVNRPNTNNGQAIGSGGTELPGAPDGQWDYRPLWQTINVPNGAINGFMPGTLLFEGVSDITPKITACGQLLYDITYSFFFRPDGHNYIYRASSDDFQRVVRVATKDLAQSAWKDLLDEADFNTLFQIA